MARCRRCGLAVALWFLPSSVFALKVANSDEGDIDLAEGFDFKEAEEQMTAAMASVLGEWSDSAVRSPAAQRAVLKRIMKDLQQKLSTPSSAVVQEAEPQTAEEQVSQVRGVAAQPAGESSEQEIVVQLNMTDHDMQDTSEDAQAELLGWKLSVANYFTPPTISQVHGTGLLAQWNRARPDKAVFPGDHIVKVNDIPWHNNTWVFVERIGEQLRATQGHADGALGQLRLKVRRQLPKSAEAVHLNSRQGSEAGRTSEDEDVAVQGEAARGQEKMRFAVDMPLPHVRGLAKTWNMLHPEDPIGADENIVEATLHLDLAREAPKLSAGQEQ